MGHCYRIGLLRPLVAAVLAVIPACRSIDDRRIVPTDDVDHLKEHALRHSQPAAPEHANGAHGHSEASGKLVFTAKYFGRLSDSLAV